MAKVRTLFFCTECGNETPRWQGQCPACQAWNTLAEEPAPERRRGARAGAPAADAVRAAGAVRLADVETGDAARWPSGMAEFDFVLGGGTVPGSLVLVGGGHRPSLRTARRPGGDRVSARTSGARSAPAGRSA